MPIKKRRVDEAVDKYDYDYDNPTAETIENSNYLLYEIIEIDGEEYQSNNLVQSDSSTVSDGSEWIIKNKTLNINMKYKYNVPIIEERFIIFFK